MADNIFSFRKRLFIDLYGWDLPICADRERDAFDTEATVYAALFHRDALVGMFRAIRTDQPYLGSSVFPQLATQIPYPHDWRSWEISRFGVLPSNGARHAVMNYTAMFHFARRVNARSLIAVADPVYERFLFANGIQSQRYGPPQIVSCDTRARPIEVVAGEITIPDQKGPKFERLVLLANEMEIRDVSQIFGPTRVSA